MPKRKDQRNRELNRAAQSCSKLTDIFKKTKPYKESKKLFAMKTKILPLLAWRVKVSYIIIFLYDFNILADFTAHYQYFYLCSEK